MSDPFQTAAFDQKTLHPFKRVNYSMGLVLGVDEFEQEQYYLLERDRLHNRALHGYGTAYGLDVQFNDGEIQVFPGLAIDSHGQHICVPEKRCADLARWVSTHQEELLQQSEETLGYTELYVTLCYRECKSDSVPVPGEPCRTQADTMVPSRIQDDFELKLSLTAPAQPQEELVDRFGDLLARMEVRENAANFLDELAIEQLVLDLLQPVDVLTDPAELYLRPSEARDLLEVAFRTWVTRVRGTLMGAECGAGDDDACLLLARVYVGLTPGSQGLEIDSGENRVTVDQSQRPVLLHTRLLQEWLLTARLSRTLDVNRQFVSLFMPDHTTLRVWMHFNQLLTLPVEAVTLTGPGAQPNILNITQPTAGVNVFDLALDRGYGRGDRLELALRLDRITGPGGASLLTLLDNLEYALFERDGARLRAYLTVEVLNLSDLSDVSDRAPTDGQVLTWRASPGVTPQWLPDDIQAVQNGDTAGGDLDGTYPDPGVIKLQGQPISNVAPTLADQVLTWDGAAWTPKKFTIPSGGGDALERDLVRIIGLGWRHNDNSTLRIELETSTAKQDVTGFLVVFGRREPNDGGLVKIETVTDMTFQVFTELPDDSTNFLRCLRIPLLPDQDILPVIAEQSQAGGLFDKAKLLELTPEGQAMLAKRVAPAFLFRLDLSKQLEPVLSSDAPLRVILKGDFILDNGDPARAIDAEFIRGELPSGNAPNGHLVGLQGGLFESWTHLRVDINKTSADDLAVAVGDPAVARHIVELRTAAGGGFANLTDLRTRMRDAQIPTEVIKRLVKASLVIRQ